MVLVYWQVGGCVTIVGVVATASRTKRLSIHNQLLAEKNNTATNNGYHDM